MSRPSRGASIRREREPHSSGRRKPYHERDERRRHRTCGGRQIHTGSTARAAQHDTPHTRLVRHTSVSPPGPGPGSGRVERIGLAGRRGAVGAGDVVHGRTVGWVPDRARRGGQAGGRGDKGEVGWACHHELVLDDSKPRDERGWIGRHSSRSIPREHVQPRSGGRSERGERGSRRATRSSPPTSSAGEVTLRRPGESGCWPGLELRATRNRSMRACNTTTQPMLTPHPRSPR